MKALVIGGTGYVSGEMVTRLMEEGHEVYALTRGQRKSNQNLPEGIHWLYADRNDRQAFAQAILQADTHFDAVYDCICMTGAHAEEDLAVLPAVTDRLVVISTDSVFDPDRKRTPQTEEGFFVDPTLGDYASNKRQMELVFFDAIDNQKTALKITLFRPGHIYGPQFPLGCYPDESRKWDLPKRILAGTPMELVSRGIYIIHPVFVTDLVHTMMACTDKPASYGQVFCIGGPEAFENKLYYETMADLLGVPLTIHEIPLTGFVAAHPEYAGHLNHRIYDLSKLDRAGIPRPSTALRKGLYLSLKGQGYDVTL